jgi:hypothetical protein
MYPEIMVIFHDPCGYIKLLIPLSDKPDNPDVIEC